MNPFTELTAARTTVCCAKRLSANRRPCHPLATFLASLSFLLACAASPRADDNTFARLANDCIQSILRGNPEEATSLGDHRFDHQLTDRSIPAIQKRTAELRHFLDQLRALDSSALSPVNQVDYQILIANLEQMLFAAEELREPEWNPLLYNPGGAIYSLISRDFAPLETRLASVAARLEKIPDLLQTARHNLRRPPKIHTETALLQNKGTISLIRTELSRFLDQAPALRGPVEKAQASALRALEEHSRWLEKDLLPRADGEFRLGDAKYRQKLRFTLESDLSKEEILRRAETELKAAQDAIYQTALPLYRGYFPEKAADASDRKRVVKAVLDRLAQDQPNNDTIVSRARETLAACIEFTRQHDLVTLPEEPLQIIVMPEFQRGVAVAYCDSPGPLEKRADTFYAISPTPSDWSAERVRSFFNEYNRYMLFDLTIHEAVPGHYLQLAHANQFKAPTKVRAIFGSGPFVEGWAVYSERFMAEAGFGGPEVRLQQLKMRLRMIINAIIDQKIHTAAMTEAEAMSLMMNEGFQEEGEAAGKWRRACLTSAQLSTYFVGNAEVEDLRRDYEKKHGPQTNLRKMHDQMLAYGSPAPKYLRQILNLP